MLSNRALMKKFERLLNKKNRIVMQQQNVNTEESGSTMSTNDLENKINKKNYNLRSVKKARLQEEFKKKELEHFLKTVEDETLKEMESDENKIYLENTAAIVNITKINKVIHNFVHEPNKIQLDLLSKIITENLEKNYHFGPKTFTI